MMLERTVFEKHLRQRLERLHGGLLITKNLHADLVSYCNDGLAYHMLLGAHQPHEVQHDTIRDTSTVSQAVIEGARIRQNLVPAPPGWKEFVDAPDVSIANLSVMPGPRKALPRLEALVQRRMIEHLRIEDVD
ncbi:hypothetical protein LTS10_009398 [Elasticomyces elasticus]|nr:hypothetical protein LTS10_009398 [Elasticomyces elasticus]